MSGGTLVVVRRMDIAVYEQIAMLPMAFGLTLPVCVWRLGL